MRRLLATSLTVLFGLTLMLAVLPWLDDEPEGWTWDAPAARGLSSGRD